MSRLSRFQEHRYVGDRRTMRVYDCDQPDQFEHLTREIEEHDLVGRLQIQTFAPDTMEEAANRGFHG